MLYEMDYSSWLYDMGLWETLDVINAHRNHINYDNSGWTWCYSTHPELFLE